MRCLMLVILLCVTGCAPLRPLIVHDKISAPEVYSVSARTPKDATLIYEKLTPVGSEKRKSDVAPVGTGLPADWGSTIVEAMKTPGWKPLMENAPEVGWSTAGIVSAFRGTWYGIIPGLVGIPLRSVTDTVKKNYEMQSDIRKMDNLTLQSCVVNNNQVEVTRVYLPKQSTHVKVKEGELEVEASREVAK